MPTDTGHPFRQKRGDEFLDRAEGPTEREWFEQAHALRVDRLIESVIRKTGRSTAGAMQLAEHIVIALRSAGITFVRDEQMSPAPLRYATEMKPGDLFQLGRKAIGVEERNGELVTVLLAEAPEIPA